MYTIVGIPTANRYGTFCEYPYVPPCGLYIVTSTIWLLKRNNTILAHYLLCPQHTGNLVLMYGDTTQKLLWSTPNV